MDIRSMHYDFKTKVNKIDSQQYKNLRIPEIDWKINEAYEIYVKAIVEPRFRNHLGFEVNQRTIDDIRTIVVNNEVIAATVIPDTGNTEYLVALPTEYMFFLSTDVTITKEGCGTKKVRARVVQHDDTPEKSSFDNSSYEWGEVNIRFFEDGIKVFTDGTFEVTSIELNFIREHAYMHNAQDFLPNNQYILPSGELLVGSVDCELPEHTHREIVDIAVLITTGELQIPDYQIKQAKLNLNQIN